MKDHIDIPAPTDPDISTDRTCDLCKGRHLYQDTERLQKLKRLTHKPGASMFAQWGLWPPCLSGNTDTHKEHQAQYGWVICTRNWKEHNKGVWHKLVYIHHN